MRKEEDIKFIESIYGQFVNEATSKIKAFWEGRYNTLIEDEADDPWLKLDFVQRNLEEIKKFYEFVRLIDEIFHLEFVKHICGIARKYGFEFDKPLIEAYGRKDMLALDLALHFPLWGRETYTNQEFSTLGFSRPESLEGQSITRVGVVRILKIEVDERNNLRTVEPSNWKVIRTYLTTIIMV